MVLILFFKSEMANEKTERVQSKASFWRPLAGPQAAGTRWISSTSVLFIAVSLQPGTVPGMLQPLKLMSVEQTHESISEGRKAMSC